MRKPSVFAGDAPNATAGTDFIGVQPPKRGGTGGNMRRAYLHFQDMLVFMSLVAFLAVIIWLTSLALGGWNRHESDPPPRFPSIESHQTEIRHWATP